VLPLRCEWICPMLFGRGKVKVRRRGRLVFGRGKLYSDFVDRFYFVRHGQTDANQQGLMCGRGWNIELNATGVAQARLARDLLSKERDLGAMRVSSLIRARQTAQILNERLNLPVTYHQDLEEWDVGDWDRRLWLEVKDQFLSDGEPPGGESRREFRERVMRVLAEGAPSESGPILVAHGGVWGVIQQLLEIDPVRAENGAVISCVRRTNGWNAKLL
jgi:broad specificity phosphatase PhoE